MQIELTIRAWIVLILLYAIGLSVVVFAVSKAIKAVVELVAFAQRKTKDNTQ